MLSLPHMRPLTEYVEGLRRRWGEEWIIPDFDPCDGGVEAKVLFLLEAPGPRAIRSGFISRNNPDQTARNMLELLDEAGLARRDTLLWNIVPWYPSGATGVQRVTPGDISAGLRHLKDLLALLPRVQVIVLVGKRAQTAYQALQTLPRVRVLRAPHPSPRNFNARRAQREEALRIFRAAA